MTMQTTTLQTGVVVARGHLGPDDQKALLSDVARVVEAAPLYVPCMPRTGKPMSVRMTNCGSLGWVTDKERGYRYQATHPVTGAPWPSMPAALLDIWRAFAGDAPQPEACLVNYYGPQAKLGMHQDRDEQELQAPVVSISLGDDARFRVGGTRRGDPSNVITLQSGDVVVLGGAMRLAYHGIDRIVAGTSDLLTPLGFDRGGRINLTLRRVTPAVR